MKTQLVCVTHSTTANRQLANQALYIPNLWNEDKYRVVLQKAGQLLCKHSTDMSQLVKQILNQSEKSEEEHT